MKYALNKGKEDESELEVEFQVRLYDSEPIQMDRLTMWPLELLRQSKIIEYASCPSFRAGQTQAILKLWTITLCLLFVETYRESTEHHASDDDDLGEVLVSPLTDGHGNV